MPPPAGCPACGVPGDWAPLETHRDPIGGKEYRLLLCRGCGVVFSEPREAVGSDWYAKAAPIRAERAGGCAGGDWRFRQFLCDCVVPGKLLDVGCGDGAFMSLAAGRGFQPVGFDYDSRVVDLARARGLDAHAAEFSDFLAGRGAGEFDCATFFDVLEHTPEPGWFFAQVKRLLKPGGCVALTLPNALRPLPLRREEHDYPPHHFTRWTPEAMRGFLERQGFEVLRQDARTLRLRYLSDHFFFFGAMPGLLSAARRLLFRGAPAGGGKTITELYASPGARGGGWLGDKLRRQRLVDGARACFQAAFTPLGLCLRTYYRLRQPLCGDCLYTFARLR